MTHLLHVDASPRGDRSVSRALTKAFMTSWEDLHPHDLVTYRDIGRDPVPLIDERWIAAAFSDPAQHTPEQTAAIQVSNELIDEFLAADCYIFGVPMYNFSSPAGFKAYLDQIVRVGRTFSVEADGSYRGLATGKKLLVITARSGSYPPETAAHAYDLQVPYLHLIFGFMGITDITVIHADNLAAGDEARRQSLAQAKTTLQAVMTEWSAR
ncbi:MAG: FMN-dependent NADH-azoreductase [Phormidesmis priestleyi Ana]|uniref:FMN dependent NADH:quinone oxidoreductase n=1 Tax=Phormidesmis priestleyi Ana TaxID=1666911 RepID=A0A0P8D715_9CYAN|nr:MAG: FMN-dependent NADH-azoreductase [Phormidesmis priestleyi Ana]